LRLQSRSAIRAVPASAQSIEEKAQTCTGCHGEDGKPVDKTIPAIWGQQLGYIYIQLRDFKRGDRKNDIMQTDRFIDGTRGHAGYRGIFLEKAMA